MLTCKELNQIFACKNLSFFVGVPDSTFKGWMTFLSQHHGQGLENIIAANECEAIAIAAGYVLATGKIPVVYMQNSGLGKCVNPLTSLCDPQVYSMGMLLMVGWRGRPGQKDEPQHKKMGQITLELLRVLGVPFSELPADGTAAAQVVADAVDYIKRKQASYALVISGGIIEELAINEKNDYTRFPLSREEAVQSIIDTLHGDEVIISTTGKTSRELFECRVKRLEPPRDFYTVGSMGCCASIALGVALKHPQRRIIVFDGDGAAIMQMGAMATVGHYQPANLTHFIFDNGCHDSTGGQPTVSSTLNFAEISKAAGYARSRIILTREELLRELVKMEKEKGPQMVVVKVRPGSRKDLGRPSTTPIENKEVFMQYLQKRL